MDKRIDYVKTFMPEGQCARCGTSVPQQWSPFEVFTGQAINLGFCGDDCEKRFVQGIKFIHQAVEYLQHKK